MQNKPNSDNRQVVPRWRSISDTSPVELKSSSKSTAGGFLLNQGEYEQYKYNWKSRRSFEHAAELLAAALVFGGSVEADDAVKYIDQQRLILPSVQKLIDRYSNPRGTSEHASEVNSLIEDRVKIARLRKQISKFPRNALLYSELSRLYIAHGIRDKSERNMELALSLQPTNRLLLRNYARLSVHLQNPEIGLKRLSESPRGDFWIDAAFAALSDICGKPVRRRIPPKKLLELNAPAEEITELLSAAGTLELKTGNSKLGKRLMFKSANGANDNTVAQLQWSNEKFDVEFDEKLLDVRGSYEARANRAFFFDNWGAAVTHSKGWAKDEPFSERPFLFGSYVAAEYLWDYVAASQLAESGLIANPHSADLLNNYAFAEAMRGNYKLASEKIKEAIHFTSDASELPAKLATSGLIAYRTNSVKEGRQLYMDAIEKAVEFKNKSGAEIAYLHMILEE
tara:strand:- start:41 stop:1402 length:1362 start_codon:yes stop_codon:yes gene_type:complete